MSQPLVSIGMPVYNGERYLEAAIRSNLNQSYGNLELIISDNASTDRTQTICRDFAATDRRIQFYRNDANIGAAANYNTVFRHSSGKFFRWSNADDLLAPDLVAQTLSVLESRPDAVIAYGRTCLIDEIGQSLGEFDDRLYLPHERPSDRYIAFHSRVTLTNIIYGLMRGDAMRKTPLMGTGIFPHADTHFMAAMTLQGTFIELPHVLFYRRMHRNALSANPSGQESKVFWTASQGTFVLPRWRYELAGFEVVLKASLPVREKARLLGYSIKRLAWFRRELAQDVRRALSSNVNVPQ